MRWDNLHVAGLGAYLPEQIETAAEAVAAGRYDAEEATSNGIRAVRVARADEPGPVMAAHAGRQAVERAGRPHEEYDIVLHGCVGHQGQDFWTPVNYVQNETVGGTGLSLEIRQGSNGGLAGLEIAASHLASRSKPAAALVTTGDAFRLPYFDRWGSDSQQAYGDGAGALVLSNQGGFARLKSTATYTDSSLEPIYRGTQGWTDGPFLDGKPVDLRTRKSDYLLKEEGAYDHVIQQMTKNASQVLQEALDDADAKLSDARFFVHANIAETIAQFSFYSLLGVDRATTTYDWGQDFGHMGAGDQLIGMNHVVEARNPQPGDLLVTMGVGVGFMWTVAVLEFTESPQW
ncbi:3-oxoacyl-ACP synthase III [Streptomyces venezuelae]|uniref:ketoacyl-ACP synthase III family protein n=1 Tax=Streptomyces gardneri TaxID=66892 RepID=UPI0006BC87DA|nr:ketoacyl-ACP synthase III family protein [Streptomyces gardneri]ALO07923.1 3-oxoacyl-ACP synthase III [Streptomyces venezuelae]QPK45213.1 ketoacyl-ACP synthase III family protein [Streptomyces gardneri]WRK36529.1 ketoacyl-ACP synthase III family protein [Streptomyces venezuelae]CUM41739.1 putative 3-oxoacyl-ACP synthase III [Streptomyces venezuelae]